MFTLEAVSLQQEGRKKKQNPTQGCAKIKKTIPMHFRTTQETSLRANTDMTTTDCLVSITIYNQNSFSCSPQERGTQMHRTVARTMAVQQIVICKDLRWMDPALSFLCAHKLPCPVLVKPPYSLSTAIKRPQLLVRPCNLNDLVECLAVSFVLTSCQDAY